MNSQFSAISLGSGLFKICICGVGIALGPIIAEGASSGANSSTNVTETPPNSPRQFFNRGTEQFRAGKLREAEATLETALASQNSRLQPPALYNLGHVRFSQGIEELKKGPAAGPTVSQAKAVTDKGADAIKSADEALADEELQKMIASYVNGRGVRKELNAAIEAVKRALESHRTTLARWQRSSGDFKSAVELRPADNDAQFNADVVDRSIARLVDSVRQLQACARCMGDKKSELSQKLKQLKGKIPASEMPPGAAGEDEEEEEQQPMGKRPEQKEGPSKEGEEIVITPEEAGWLLQGFKLDADRRLPMAPSKEGQPRSRTGPTW